MSSDCQWCQSGIKFYFFERYCVNLLDIWYSIVMIKIRETQNAGLQMQSVNIMPGLTLKIDILIISPRLLVTVCNVDFCTSHMMFITSLRNIKYPINRRSVVWKNIKLYTSVVTLTTRWHYILTSNICNIDTNQLWTTNFYFDSLFMIYREILISFIIEISRFWARGWIPSISKTKWFRHMLLSTISTVIINPVNDDDIISKQIMDWPNTNGSVRVQL